jgi:hypothetical protein
MQQREVNNIELSYRIDRQENNLGRGSPCVSPFGTYKRYTSDGPRFLQVFLRMGHPKG